MAADAPEVACCCSCLARNISAAAAAPPGPPLRAADKRPLMALADSAWLACGGGGGVTLLAPSSPLFSLATPGNICWSLAMPSLEDGGIGWTSSAAVLAGAEAAAAAAAGDLLGTRSRKDTLVFCCPFPFSPTI